MARTGFNDPFISNYGDERSERNFFIESSRQRGQEATAMDIAAKEREKDVTIQQMLRDLQERMQTKQLDFSREQLAEDVRFHDLTIQEQHHLEGLESERIELERTSLSSKRDESAFMQNLLRQQWNLEAQLKAPPRNTPGSLQNPFSGQSLNPIESSASQFQIGIDRGGIRPFGQPISPIQNTGTINYGSDPYRNIQFGGTDSGNYRL